MATPLVTVAVPVKDRREQMLRCLDALLALEHPSYEVLVLDNESSDGTAEACRRRAADAPVPVRVVVKPGGVGRLRNVAAQMARGRILAYTDSDCTPTPSWLTEAVALLESDPSLGLVQGRTLPDPAAEVRAWSATQNLPEWSGRYECCNLFVRREALLESEGFDEEIFFSEDTAGGAAVVREGWGTAFAPGSVVHHGVTYPGFEHFLRRGLMYGNLARTVRRYPELRRELLWCRVFLRPRSAKFAAAVAGLALAKADRRALLLAFPYAWERRPPGFSWRAIAFDAAIFAGTVKGSLRHRALVL